jgi:hypothetical protein
MFKDIYLFFSFFKSAIKLKLIYFVVVDDVHAYFYECRQINACNIDEQTLLTVIKGF